MNRLWVWLRYTFEVELGEHFQHRSIFAQNLGSQFPQSGVAGDFDKMAQ